MSAEGAAFGPPFFFARRIGWRTGTPPKMSGFFQDIGLPYSDQGEDGSRSFLMHTHGQPAGSDARRWISYRQNGTACCDGCGRA